MSWEKLAGSRFETYKKEAVASNGMVATNHPLGSAAGLETLAMGRERDGRGGGVGLRSERGGADDGGDIRGGVHQLL